MRRRSRRRLADPNPNLQPNPKPNPKPKPNPNPNPNRNPDPNQAAPASLHVVVVGAGPCGLFAALTLAQAGVRVTMCERGKPVEQRGKDVGALVNRRILNSESNFCYGEGGAGTWSDGKLTTRIGRNSAAVATG